MRERVADLRRAQLLDTGGHVTDLTRGQLVLFLGFGREDAEMLAKSRITDADLESATVMLRQLERFWIEAGNPFGPIQTVQTG